MDVSNETLQGIVDELEVGLKCFLNIKTHEVVAFPDEDQRLGMDSEIWETEIEKVENDVEDFIEIKNMTSSESFLIMEDFIGTVGNARLKAKLNQAVQGHKPFSNFKHLIDQSVNYRNKWFAFKKDKLIEWVVIQLSK